MLDGKLHGLLAKAAKAAGYKVNWWGSVCDGRGGPTFGGYFRNSRLWKPHNDFADAFDLARQCQMKVTFGDTFGIAECPKTGAFVREEANNHNNKEDAAVMMAIVKCAALASMVMR